MSGAEDSGSLGGEGGKRARLAPLGGPLVCLIEGCGMDLTGAKDYHQRHKVCEEHARAATVMHKGQVMRFCQQCSRFHLLAEFDEGKRSCRRRLLGHNKRRRKKEEATSESDQTAPPALQSPSLAALNEYDIRDDVRRRITASLLADHLSDRSPTLQLGHGLALNSLTQQQSQQPAAEARSSLAISQYLQQRVAAQRSAQESALNSLLLGSQAQASEGLGRTPGGLNASQQLLLHFPTQQEQAPKPDTQSSLLQLHFPDIAGTRQSPSLQQLLDKPAQTWASSSHQVTTTASSTSALFPFPSSLQLLQSGPLAVQPTPSWTARSLEGLEEGPKGPLPLQAASFSASDRTGRISFKLFDKSPEDLPLDLRDQILDWLQRRPAAMETYLRPGCVHVSAFLAMPEEHWAELEARLQERLYALIQGPKTGAWAGGRFMAFVRDEVAWVERGLVQPVFPLVRPRSPVLLSVHPRWAVPGRPLHVTLAGQGLQEADTRILCLHKGRRLMDCRVSVPSPAVAGAEPPLHVTVDLVLEQGAPLPCAAAKAGGGLQWSPLVSGGHTSTAIWKRDAESGLEMLCFTLHVPSEQAWGNVWVELERCGVPSSMRPLLLVDAPVCAELAQLEAELQLTAEAGGSPAAGDQLEAFLTDLGWLVGGAAGREGETMLVKAELGEQALAFAESQGMVHTSARLVQAIATLREGARRAGTRDESDSGMTIPLGESAMQQGSGEGAWLGVRGEDGPFAMPRGVQAPDLTLSHSSGAAWVPVRVQAPERGSCNRGASGPSVAEESSRHDGSAWEREQAVGQLFPWHLRQHEVGSIRWIADTSKERAAEVW